MIGSSIFGILAHTKNGRYETKFSCDSTKRDNVTWGLDGMRLRGVGEEYVLE
jgi:hypothetical protein